VEAEGENIQQVLERQVDQVEGLRQALVLLLLVVLELLDKVIMELQDFPQVLIRGVVPVEVEVAQVGPLLIELVFLLQQKVGWVQVLLLLEHQLLELVAVVVVVIFQALLVLLGEMEAEV
tara:strand:- start:139 stop:498 length:360 start_codon:yes stop_codon:yes gene_type:complete